MADTEVGEAQSQPSLPDRRAEAHTCLFSCTPKRSVCSMATGTAGGTLAWCVCAAVRGAPPCIALQSCRTHTVLPFREAAALRARAWSARSISQTVV